MRDSKTCQRCGRTIEWRTKWKSCWEEVKYCSAACRKPPRQDPGTDIQQAIVSLLQSRPRASSICPSEVARQLAPGSWRELMEPTRQSARLLTSQGIVEITQQNRRIDPSTAKGPIRIRRGPNFPHP